MDVNDLMDKFGKVLDDTRRDRLAVAVLPLIWGVHCAGKQYFTVALFQEISKTAYGFADVMLAESDKRNVNN